MVTTHGAFAPILHGHLPYIPADDRHLHEFTSRTLIPLLQVLYQLQDENVPFALTISLSPPLIEQLNDKAAPAAFHAYIDSQIAAARHDHKFFQSHRLIGSHNEQEPGDPHMAYLAEQHLATFENIKADFNARFNQDIVGAFRQLQDANRIEIIASPITHAYLPLLKTDTSVIRQIRLGIAHYQKTFDRQPTGMWLPELGYRPGLETFLADEGITAFVCESHTLTGGAPVGVAAGDNRGTNSIIKHRYALPEHQHQPVRNTSTMQPYWADDTARIATIARDNRSTMQVWGETLGYPGDVDYLEMQRRSGTSNLPYWRITGHNINLPTKDAYHPEWARYKVEQHAEHFAHLIGDMVREYQAESGQPGLIAPAFDMRLLGQWWQEGIAWLAQTCRHLANGSQIELTTISRHVAAHPPTEHIQLTEGSWGTGGHHFLVDNPATRWLWSSIHEAEQRIAHIDRANLTDNERGVFNQAIRQLLLLQSSDWETMITTHQAATYATCQFRSQHKKLNQLLEVLDGSQRNQQSAIN